jgi:hypothetical protein
LTDRDFTSAEATVFQTSTFVKFDRKIV